MTPTAMLLLTNSGKIDQSKLLDTLRMLFPTEAHDARIVDNRNDKPAATLILLGGQGFAILERHARLPEGWQSVAKRSTHWSQAMTICDHHHAHIVIAPMGDIRSALQSARLTAAIAGALTIHLSDSVLGVLWGASVLNSAEEWQTQSKRAFAQHPDLPVNLWISVHPFEDQETGYVGVLTQGLSRFIERELELLDSSANGLTRLANTAYSLAGYLIQNGSIMNDGDTFGISSTDRVRIALCESIRFPGLSVIAASIEKIEMIKLTH